MFSSERGTIFINTIVKWTHHIMVRFWVTLFLHALIKEELRDIDKKITISKHLTCFVPLVLIFVLAESHQKQTTE